MKIIKINKLTFFLLAGLLTACSHTNSYSDLDLQQRLQVDKAACAAEAYLSRNGYIEQLSVSNKESIQLELWDNLEYKSDREFDWSRLLKDRSGLFQGRLHGVKLKNYESLVYYQFEDLYRCVSVDARAGKVFLHEANCLLDDQVTVLKNSDLTCPFNTNN